MRTKPSKQLLATTHEADEETYQKLAQACLRACILREKNLYISLPYFAKIDESFPRGVLVQKAGLNDIFKIKVVKLTNWLHSKGFLPEDHRGIMLSLRDMAYREARINKILLDTANASEYNGNLEIKEEE